MADLTTPAGFRAAIDGLLRHLEQDDAAARHDGILEPDSDGYATARVREIKASLDALLDGVRAMAMKDAAEKVRIVAAYPYRTPLDSSTARLLRGLAEMIEESAPATAREAEQSRERDDLHRDGGRGGGSEL